MNTRRVVLSLLVSLGLTAPAAAQFTSGPVRPASETLAHIRQIEAPSALERLAPTATTAPNVPSDAIGQAAAAPQATTPSPRGIDWTGEAADAPRLKAPAFGRIFQDLGGDFSRLPTRENALLLGLGAGLAGLAAPNDTELTSSMHGNTGAKGFFGPGAYIGNFYLNLGASFATYAVGRATGNAKIAILGADLARAQIVSQATTQGLKYVAGRTRPDGTDRSFPSGHTSSAFATATVLQRHYGWKVGIPAYALAGYVGASRLHANKHYLSDVAFGAALGIIAGRTVTVGIGSTKFALAPMAAKGGVGISFTKVSKK
jgi:membrane-associated phospholipid phosphatase